MSNKKQSKKEPAVLLGLPDRDVEVDNDVYATKLGGLPIWLDPATIPSKKLCTCRICGDAMYLIFQSYIPLPDSPYHRVIYVWGCNKRSCMRKEGSFSVVRSHVVDPTYLKAQRQKEEENRKREEKKKAAAAKAAAANQGFQLGDLWGNSAGSFGANTGSGFGLMNGNTTGGFGTTTNNTGGFGMSNNNNGFGMKKTAAQVVAFTPFGQPAKKEDTLIEKMTELTMNEEKVDINTLPQFPGKYLYIDEEKTDNYEALGIDMNKYKEYLDMEKEILAMEIDDEVWQGETYEKQHLPKGVDKQFKKFTERVEFEPSQCARFGSQPLFYSAINQKEQESVQKTCPYCKGQRQFELQLMPNILSLLPTAEYASLNESKSNSSGGKAKNIDAKTLLDSWNVGMEFGTILIFTCQKDCHPTEIEENCFMEETIIVQYETD